jgi:hypothetical protein
MPQDTQPPVISLVGSSAVTVRQFSLYVDAGATAEDVVDGFVPVSATSTCEAEDGSATTLEATSVPATCRVRYTAVDAAGNAAPAVTRTVTVMALCEPPSFVCDGTQSCAACEGGACLCWVTVEDELDTETAVVVEEYVPPVDTTPPVITMIVGDGRWGSNPDGSTFVFHVVSQHGVFVDPGATAVDDEDGELTVSAYGAAAVSTTTVTPEVRGDASRVSYVV